MALNDLASLPQKYLNIVLCVDSKSVLCTLNSLNENTRLEMITKIKHVVHLLARNGTGVIFAGCLLTVGSFLMNGSIELRHKEQAVLKDHC